MGFKDMVYTQDHDEVKNKLNKLSQIKQRIIKIVKNLNEDSSIFPQYENCDIKLISFSDSIVFFTNEDKPNDFLLLSYAIKSIISQAIQLGIPIKGAISYGLMTADFENSIFFGKPLINSYLLQEEVQYYGVILDNYAETFLNKHKDNIDTSKLFFAIKTPLKKGNVTHTNLSLIDNTIKKFNLNKLYETVCGPARIYVDNTISVYDTMTQLKKIITGEAEKNSKQEGLKK